MAPAILIASAAVTAIGALSAAQAQKASYKSQQSADMYNATVQRDNAAAAQAAASANELAQRRDNDVKLSFERARIIESGGGLVGTNVGALDQSAANLELSALNTRYRGQVQAVGDMQQSMYDQFQGDVAGQNAKSAQTAGWLGAAGSALGAGANYYNARSIYDGGSGSSSSSSSGGYKGGW